MNTRETPDPKVFVTQESNHDFHSAEGWGKVEFLTVDKRDDFNNNINSESNERMLAHLGHKLRDFEEGLDYLILTGSPYINAAVFWILGHRQVRVINILRWSNRDRVYIPMQLKLRREV